MLHLLIMLALAVGLSGPTAPPLRIAEDDAGWIPALYDANGDHVSPFSPAFPSLSTPER